MPFINEQLDHNAEQLERRRYQQKAARASRFKFKPEDVITTLHEQIVGQANVLSAVEDMLFTLKADFGNSQRPLSVMLFTGPTGVGKTETVRLLAESMLGDADKLCSIDMNTLAQEHYSAAITGSPPGYVGSKEGQTLFDLEKIRGTFSEPGIVLFDEIEKADNNVVRALMNILDTGKLQLTSGLSEIDFSNTLIFMTSNIAAKEQTATIKKYAHGWRALLKLKPPASEILLDAGLNDHFDPEFINRIDRILPFNSLNSAQLESLFELELAKLNNRLKARNAAVQADADAQAYLCKAYDARYGARDIARRIRVELEPKLSRAMLNHPEISNFEARMVDNVFQINTADQ